MNAIFPFGFPAPTALYLTLFVLTLVLHMLFMNYVLAGSAYVAISSLTRQRTQEEAGELSISSILRDWMPFAVSAAITAGVAPILFVQILYKENFYTANLLLFHRWMSIVPVLIVGFYMTYLLKSRKLANASFGWRWLVGFGALACFSFTALSWTENHLLSLNRESWTGIYARGTIFYRNAEILPRLAMWTFLSFPTMAAWVGWQLLSSRDSGVRHARRLALTAFVGLLASVAAAIAYYLMMSKANRAAAIGAMTWPYLILMVVGIAAQFAAWHFMFHRKRIFRGLLILASLGTTCTLLGAAVLREAIRVSSIDIERLYPQHAEAATKSGLAVFLVFAAANAVAIAWCLRIVRHNRIAATGISTGIDIS